MKCLVLRFAAPMQSWGVQSRFTDRDTTRYPTKSAVLGLLCAAAGVDRQDDAELAKLAALEMGVRIDRDGMVATDFHTAGGGTINGEPYKVLRASGGFSTDAVLSKRHYLADAEFRVALGSSDSVLLDRYAEALRNPHWLLYLGRKSFPPTPPLYLGMHEGAPLEVLSSLPWLKPDYYKEKDGPPSQLRILIEVPPGQGATRGDSPLSFDNGRRAFGLRTLSDELCTGFPVVDSLEEVVSCS